MIDPAIDRLREALVLLRESPDRRPLAVAVELALSLAESGNSFGQLLHRQRKAARLSIHQIAKRARIAVNTVKNYESGRTIPGKEALAQLLAIPELRLSTTEQAPIEDVPNSYFLPLYNRRQLLQQMEQILNGEGGALEQSMLYLDDQSAGDWLALCRGTVSWGSFRALPMDHVAELLAPELSSGVDINALGAGDGRSEVALCEHILGVRPDADLRLHLLDISHPLLHAAHEYAKASLADRVPVKTLHGNFHHLWRFAVLLPRSAPDRRRIYSLVGHTMSNLDNEVAWIRDQLSLAAPGDFMIVDYSTAYAPPEEPEQIRALDPPLSNGVPPLHVEWVTGPIKRYARNVVDVTVKLELNTYCTLPGSYELATYATVQRKDGSSQRYLLTRVRRYTTDKLRACLESLGWQWVAQLPYGPTGRAAVAILRRGERR